MLTMKNLFTYMLNNIYTLCYHDMSRYAQFIHLYYTGMLGNLADLLKPSSCSYRKYRILYAIHKIFYAKNIQKAELGEVFLLLIVSSYCSKLFVQLQDGTNHIGPKTRKPIILSLGSTLFEYQNILQMSRDRSKHTTHYNSTIFI